MRLHKKSHISLMCMLIWSSSVHLSRYERDYSWLAILAWDFQQELIEITKSHKNDLWSDKDQDFRLKGVVPFFTNHCVFPLFHL